MRWRIVLLSIFLTLVLVVVSQPLLAQECTELIRQAFANLAEVCEGLGNEAACAGDSTSIDNAEETLTELHPGDVALLSEFNTISTTSEVAESYGLALVNVQGNVPLALSETGIHFMLIGAAAIQNQVDTAAAFTPGAAVTVATFVGANLRSSPSTNGRVVGSALPGAELIAYGLSSDQEWLLALNGNESVWISRSVVGVQGEGDLNSLPVIRGGERSAFQSSSLTTASETPDCAGTPPSMLLLQGPEGFNSLVEVNGVEIRFTSTIALRITPENQMQLIVLDGGALTNNLPLPAGFTMFIPLSEDGQVSSGWTGVRPISGTERALLSPLESMPHDNWYTAIEIPTDEEVAQVLASLNTAAVGQTVAGPAAGSANCSGFRPTSPLDGLPNRGDAAFFWDGAPGATGYRVNILNESGAVVRSVDIGSNTTTLVTDTTDGSIGGGTTFSWEVAALVNGQVACTTGRATMLRDTTPFVGTGGGGGGSRATPTACPWASC